MCRYVCKIGTGKIDICTGIQSNFARRFYMRQQLSGGTGTQMEIITKKIKKKTKKKLGKNWKQ